jgi:hypothetical protein
MELLVHAEGSLPLANGSTSAAAASRRSSRMSLNAIAALIAHIDLVPYPTIAASGNMRTAVAGHLPGDAREANRSLA